MGQILLVTGASSDIGLAAIHALQSDCDMVLAQYRHSNAKLDALREELGDRITCLQADLADDVQLADFVQTLKTRNDKPTHFLHLPALPPQIRKFHKTEWSVFQQQLDVSVRSFVEVAGAVLPQMVAAGGGKVLVMLSMAVNNMPPKYNSDYVMAKYALLGLVKALAVEYAEKGITVNGISPSLVETRFVSGMHGYLIEQNAKASPTGKNLQVADVIPTIDFLFSEGADSINGQNISVTCGR